MKIRQKLILIGAFLAPIGLMAGPAQASEHLADPTNQTLEVCLEDSASSAAQLIILEDLRLELDAGHCAAHHIILPLTQDEQDKLCSTQPDTTECYEMLKVEPGWRWYLESQLLPPAAPKASGGGGDYPRPGGNPSTPMAEQWRGLVSGYDWDVYQGLKVIWCESRGDPTATHPTSGAGGIWQLLGWEHKTDPYDPVQATAWAYVLWLDGKGSFLPHWRSTLECWG